MIYGFLDKSIKGTNLREVTACVNGIKYIQMNDEMAHKGSLSIPSDATEIVIHGVLRGNGDLIREANKRKIPWTYIDNGYLGKYKRVIQNATAPTTLHTGKRFEHNTKLEPWRGGTGKNILVLPPSPPYMDAFGARDFLNFIAHNVNIYTDKNIVVRAKPAKGKLARPWDEQLAEAYCVISWGSALSLDAIKKGVPTISLGWCPASLSSFGLEDLETSKLKEEPPRQETFDNLTWSSFDRNELSKSWEQCKKNSEKTSFNNYKIDNTLET